MYSLDPHLALEPDSMLSLDDGEYYLLPNIAHIIKVKYVHQSIRIIGNKNLKYNVIDANTL